VGSTIIRRGVKLDNLIQVGHNVEIGENTVIAAQTGISGSTKVGRNCMIGGQVASLGILPLPTMSRSEPRPASAAASPNRETILLGAPAIEIGRFKRSIAVFYNLDKLVARVSELERNAKQSDNR
jgi:UDP-3-O-[3-hydroxymyristoyl] glucosamine N-acyltransferase